MALPSAVGLCILSEDLVRLFYGAGAFMADDGVAIRCTANVVFFFSLGLCFYSLNAVLIRAINATKDTISFQRITCIAVGVNLILNLVLVWSMREAGLALASAISAGVQTILLARVLFKNSLQPDWSLCRKFFLNIFGSVAGCSIAALLVYQHMSAKENAEGIIAFFAALAIILLPLHYLGKSFFKKQLGVKPEEGEKAMQYRLGIPESKWTQELIFYHGLYSTIVLTTIMGLVVWAVQDSFPPEGLSKALIFQRGVIPVVFGIFIYLMLSGGLQSREYEELRRALSRKKKKPTKTA